MKDYTLKVKTNDLISENAFKLVLETNESFGQIKAGQFLHIEVPGFSLRRPFCIYDFDKHTITAIIAIVGKGTKALSQVRVGTELKCILPIGMPFELSPEHKKVMLIGGGFGAAPLFPIFKNYPDREYYAFLGFSNASLKSVYEDYATKCKNTYLATVDGSLGTKGLVLDLIDLKPTNGKQTIVVKENKTLQGFSPDVVLACGPHGMLKALKTVDFGCDVYVSMEARMGCGVGACLVCTCPIEKSKEIRNMRVCVDGPVFNLKEVVL